MECVPAVEDPLRRVSLRGARARGRGTVGPSWVALSCATAHTEWTTFERTPLMIYSQFTSGRELTRALAGKLFFGGVFLIAVGVLIVVAPQLVAIPLSVLLFLAGFFCLSWAWRIFWASRSMPTSTGAASESARQKDYEDATFREIR